MKTRSLGAAVVLGLFASAAAQAQVGADGIDWCTIGAAGNHAYDGPDPFNHVTGRGSVGYEFKMGRTEVTTEQWLGLFNAALARPDPLPFTSTVWWGTPILWGATRDTSYTGPGTRYRLRTDVANAGMLPVSGISWRMAAVLCNYYEHGRDGSSAANFMSGAYDVSTFTPNVLFPTTFADQPVHTVGAHYWIPTLDEFLKAVHFDPNANGGAGRWWQQPNGTDTPLIYGPPQSFGGDGTGQANSGFTLPNNAQYLIPLGAYPTVQSPWGLLDVAGGTKEWIEDIREGSPMYRNFEGSYWNTDSSAADFAYSLGADSPSVRFSYSGFRLASSVPAPSSALVFIMASGVFARTTRRFRCNASPSFSPSS